MTEAIKTNNKLVQLMSTGKSRLLNIYCTAGFPDIDDTSIVLRELERAGADMIELGMPFSDPLADGPIIQKSSMRALQNGMTMELLFRQLKDVTLNIPLILMGYINPVLQYGVDKFCASCDESGVDGVILPDLPHSLYKARYRETFEKHGLCNICLVTPQTTEERVKAIDEVSTGFIYAVSSASTTGTKDGVNNTDAYLKGLSEMDLRNPILTGFNIRDAVSFDRATKYTRGGIIGSAFINAIADAGDLTSAIHSFVKQIRP